MRKVIKFYYHLLCGRYTEALSQLPAGQLDGGMFAIYACYRMGLYLTVSNSSRREKGGLARFSSIVSLAACGRYSEAEELVRCVVDSRRPLRYRTELACSIAPYMPKLAISSLNGVDAPPDVATALYLQVGNRKEALRRARVAFSAGLAKGNPELYLLLSNAEKGTPDSRLAYLNGFLASHSLAPVGLKDPAKFPSAANVIGTPGRPSPVGPLVTVLVTAFRVKDRIGVALESLLNQTYRNLEVIVVDDASDDGLDCVVTEMARMDSRLRYFRLPWNVGTYAAKTFGLMRATGEFVTCHDADDWAHPSRIELQVAPLIHKPNIVFSISHWVRMQDDGEYYARQVMPLLRLNPASPMFRRELVARNAGLWDLVRTGADSEFFARLKLVFGTGSMVRIAKPLTIGAHRPGSLTTDHSTGFGGSGVSLARIQYWEEWVKWHLSELQQGRKPRLPFPSDVHRAFDAPSELVPPRENLDRCLSQGSLTP